MNTVKDAYGFALKTFVLILLVAGYGCSNGGSSSQMESLQQVGSLQISHSLEGSAAEFTDQSLYSVISGLDASESVIYGPLRLPYADEHTLKDVPTAVERIRIEYRLTTGRQIAVANEPAEVRVNQVTQVRTRASGAPNSVTVQLVNDTDNSGGDEKMFVLFDTPKSGGATSGIDLLNNSGKKGANATGKALSTLWPKAKGVQPTLTSPYTGKSRPVYSFTLDHVDSGRLTFSYETPASILDGAAPTAAANYRYDKLEITYLKDTQSGGGNITAIDFFAIPLQVEVIRWGDTTPDPLQTKSIYASTPTILKTLKGLAPNRMGTAFKDLSGEEYHFPVRDPFDLSTFARVLSPNTIADASKNGSPSPYPSFGGPHGYLETLVGKTYKVKGEQYGGYSYTAKFERDKEGGYLVHCTGTTAGTLPSGLPRNAAVTLHLPKDQLDFFIYANVANKTSYSIAGFPFVDGPSGNAEAKVKLANASPYGALLGDLQAALNFGYLGGRFDSSATPPRTEQDIDTYYESVLLPYAYPYSGARIKKDGFYNPYAGLFYYLSDAYGHSFSDRLAAASPLYSLEAGDTVRITILNDHRLDTPIVEVKSAEKTKLHLTWPKVPGATGYTVEVSPEPSESQGPFKSQDHPIQSHVITGLKPGTSYLVSVKATGKNSGQSIASAALPIQGVTNAEPSSLNDAAAAGPDKPSFKLSLSLTSSFSTMSYLVNGQAVKYQEVASVQGHIGLNTLNLSILDADKNVVYQGTYFVNLEQATEGHFKVAAPFALEYNLKPLTAAGPPGTPPYPLGPDLPLTVGTPFAPKPYYKPFEVTFPKLKQ